MGHSTSSSCQASTSHLEFDWEEPRHAAFLERLASFSRLIRLDKRGTGPLKTTWGLLLILADEDGRRVRGERCWWHRASGVVRQRTREGRRPTLFFATYPEWTRALALYGTFATSPPYDLDEVQRAAVIDAWGQTHWRRLQQDPPPRPMLGLMDVMKGMAGRSAARPRQSRRHPGTLITSVAMTDVRDAFSLEQAPDVRPLPAKRDAATWHPAGGARDASSRTRSPARGSSSRPVRARCRDRPARSWRDRGVPHGCPADAGCQSGSRDVLFTESSARRRRPGRSEIGVVPARRAAPRGAASGSSTASQAGDRHCRRRLFAVFDGRHGQFAVRSASNTRSRRWASGSVGATRARWSAFEATSLGASP